MRALFNFLAQRRLTTVPAACFFIVSLIIVPLHGQAPDPTEPAKSAAADNAAHVQTRIRELEGTANLDEQKAKLLENYRQIQARIDNARANTEKTEQLRAALETAPADSARIRQQLTTPEPATTKDPWENETAEQLQQRLIQEQGLLADQKTKKQTLEQSAQAELDRPAKARTQLADTKQILAQVEEELTKPAPSGDAPELERSQRILLEARKKARISEIRMLEEELLGSAARAELIAANRDLITRQIPQIEARIQRLENRISQVRQEEAGKARLEAQRLRREAMGKHPIIQALAGEITKLTEETHSLGPLIDAVQKQRAAVESESIEIGADLEEARKTLGETAISDSMGAILLDHRQRLPRSRRFEKDNGERMERISSARLRLFKLDRQLNELNDPKRVVAKLLDESKAVSESTDHEGLAAEIETLVVLEREETQRLTGLYRSYLEELGKLEAAQSELSRNAKEFSDLLDEHLLWIRNAETVGKDTLVSLPLALRWLIDPANWSFLPRVLLNALTPLYAIALLGAILIVVLRGRLQARLIDMGSSVGKVRLDGLGLTFRGLLITVILATPFSIVTGVLALRISAGGPVGSEFSKSIAFGLAAAAMVTFAAQLVRSVCRPSGIGELHFRWNKESTKLIRDSLSWFVWIAVPAIFVSSVMESQSDLLFRHSLGRIAFLTVMITTSVLAHRLLRPSAGVLRHIQEKHPSSLIARGRWIWYSLGVGGPVVLAVLAAAGFDYTARELQLRLAQTVLILLSAAFGYAFFFRWLVLSQRRLALKIAIEKRQALARSKEAEDISEAQDGLLDMLEEIDVTEIKDQTVELLRMSVIIFLIGGLWLAWSGVLPAFKILNDIPLWTHAVVVDGQETLRPITLSNIILSVVAILFTIVSARNFPGFLEIAVLQRLPLDPGTRYATRTLCLYIIAGVGIVVGFNLIGIGWSSVQWLVAALTVGLGFGLQEIFANFVSGLIILLERPVRVGDTVTVGTISGVVTRIRMRATTITDWNRKELIVPNKTFITAELINWSLSDPVLRLDFPVGIAYGSDTTLAHRVILQVVKDHPLVMKQPEPNVFFLGFGDNSLSFDVRAFVQESTNTGRTRILHDLHMAIDRTCRAHDIVIAFPQRDLHLKTADAVIRVAHVSVEPPPKGPEPGTTEETRAGDGLPAPKST